jgi:acyl-CoA thioesterase-1
MNPIVYHVASGQSFFTGVGLLLIAAASAHSKHWLLRRVTVLACILGGIAIAISSTPLPYWLLVVAIVVSIVWASSPWWSNGRGWATLAFGTLWIAAAAWEASHLIVPSVAPVDERAVAIIGDSVTAGMGERKVETWPMIFAREHDVRVQDLSYMGDKTSHARKRIAAQPVDAPLVFVEIGGNDVLGGTTAAKFREELDHLLADLRKDDRQVVMFELPLPPFRGDFGRAQRSLARKHGVVLVPKRIMLDVLAADGATVDTIHLSPAGHQSMCDAVWRLLQETWERE